MKTYTLRIIYNERTGELQSLEETISQDETPIAIECAPYIMEKLDQAGLIDVLLVDHPGERVGEA